MGFSRNQVPMTSKVHTWVPALEIIRNKVMQFTTLYKTMVKTRGVEVVMKQMYIQVQRQWVHLRRQLVFTNPS